MAMGELATFHCHYDPFGRFRVGQVECNRKNPHQRAVAVASFVRAASLQRIDAASQPKDSLPSCDSHIEDHAMRGPFSFQQPAGKALALVVIVDPDSTK